MKDFLEFMVKSLVDKPDQIKIEEKEDEEGVHFTLEVAEEDMGRIIGKEGKIIKSIRHLLRVAAIKQGKKVFLDLVEKGEKKETQTEEETKEE